MRILVLMAACAVAFASPATASAADRLTRLPTVGPFAADATFGAYVSKRAVTTTLPGPPFAALTVASRDDRGAGDLTQLGFSTLPFQFALDPRQTTQRYVAYSRCATSAGAARVSCVILGQNLTGAGATGHPALVSDPTALDQDRLPAAYAGAVAFSRARLGQSTDELRFSPRAGQMSQRLRGGPAGSGAANIAATALRGTTVAYVWRWQNAKTGPRNALFLETPGGTRSTVVSLDSSHGRIFGAVWRGTRLLFAVRHGSSSRLYEYAPASGTFRSAKAPRNLGAFAIGGSTMYWETASLHATATGTCPLPGCELLRDKAPAFKRAARPR